MVKEKTVLNELTSKEIEWHCKHYVGRGLMRKFSGEALTKKLATFDDYNDIASNKKKDPIGKKFFHNVPITINDQFYVVLMSPVLHYTMSDCWVVVKGEGLNVTNFFQIILVLAVKKAILIYAGKDATEEVRKFSLDLFVLNAY
ncbi:hypothetical protein C2G38_2235438 [Gigaspora rosea]|uniref:Uncharacterized protein n=1 Tax=Gigaspora rosea TaxID=44941 RepID=A0A397TUV8_9GLOM|nr:hypothetical protein C2G38_2235438 [Gigaspora rosea]